MNRIITIAVVIIVLGLSLQATAQQHPDRCGTMQLLESTLSNNPMLKQQFNNNLLQLQQEVSRRIAQPNARANAATVYIPVVFHIVMTNPAVVTDAQLQAQLDTLNKDCAGQNADSSKIPAAFKPLFGKSNIQFVLAARTPDNQPSNGIVRKVTTKTSFSMATDGVKYASSGGDNAWDANRFMNVWICNLSGGVLGYATPPGSSSNAAQGIVVLYSSLPGGAYPYDQGRTLTHETGHYFFLYHIWGDDGGGCSGTDGVNDTPDQSDATFGCPNGTVVTDMCTTTTPGILYEDFMDYTDDACMVMFTNQQVTRMQTALSLYRSSLLTSNGAIPPTLNALDASLVSNVQMPTRVCTATFSPVVNLYNKGSQTLTSVSLLTSIDGGAAVTTKWTGSIKSLSNTVEYVSPITLTAGRHTIKITVVDPNGGTDLDATNNTLSYVVDYYPPASIPFAEDFEGTVFPPAGWDIVDADKVLTWQKINGVSASGSNGVKISNYSYTDNDQKDYLRLPQLEITNTDSAFLSFELAAAGKTNTGTINFLWDTLQVLISTDCGATYTSLYKKWGNGLFTGKATSDHAFVPASNEWRKDSIDLSAYINKGPVMLAFRNTTENGNDIFIDDINIYKKAAVNSALRDKGWLVTPNPVRDVLTVQFYPLPENVKGINIYNSAGQKVASRLLHTQAAVYGSYQFDCRQFASGVYIVQVVFGDRTEYRKIVK